MDIDQIKAIIAEAMCSAWPDKYTDAAQAIYAQVVCKYEERIAALQALCLEYCADELPEEERQDWASHQTPLEDSTLYVVREIDQSQVVVSTPNSQSAIVFAQSAASYEAAAPE